MGGWVRTRGHDRRRVGRPTETETEPEGLVEELRDAVPRGHSAIALLAAPEHVDAMLAALDEKHESVLRRTLTVGQAAAILASVSTAPHASSGPSRAGEAAPSAG